MPKEIDMYNTYFGDCYMVKNEGSNLLVDFGIHSCASVWKNTYGDRQNLIKGIAEDIVKRYEQVSVLITHFHTDHIYGLIYMYKSGLKKYKGFFNKIYVPNVWGNPFSIVASLLEEMLLRIQFKQALLPGKTCSLIDLVEFLCANARNVELLSRGVSFENDKYLVLWPLKNISRKEYKELLYHLNMPATMLKSLYKLSKSICIYVQGILNQGEDGIVFDPKETYAFKENYQKIITEYEQLITNLDKNEQLNKLNKLNHKINIIFHDKVNGDENILFTGDAEESDINEIVSKTDYPVYDSYKFIKVPHHGTRTHYYDFLKYNPAYILISNGVVKGHENDDAYKIDKRYGALNAEHFCSNSNNCLCCMKSCNSNLYCCGKTKNIVFPSIYKVIR